MLMSTPKMLAPLHQCNSESNRITGSWAITFINVDVNPKHCLHPYVVATSKTTESLRALTFVNVDVNAKNVGTLASLQQ
jgi:hypothetical protein